MQGPILVVNAGSASIKFSGFAAMDKEEPILLFNGQVEGIGLAPHLTAKDATGAAIAEKTWPRDRKSDHEALFDHLIGRIPAHLGGRTPVGVGHRVVHGCFCCGDTHRRAGFGRASARPRAGYGCE